MDARCNALCLAVRNDRAADSSLVNARFLVAICAATLFTASVFATGAVCHGQAATAGDGAAEQVTRWTSRQRSFDIPFHLGEDDTVSVVELYYSHNGQAWKLHERMKAGDGKFNFQAKTDGAYWFTSRTIDSQNRANPAGPLQAELLVIVDATAPKVDLQLKPDAAGSIQCSWQIEDPGLDPKSLKLEYEVDGQWIPVAVQLPPQQLRAGVTKLQGGVTWRPEGSPDVTQVRLTIADSVGNEAQPINSVRMKPAEIASVPQRPATTPANQVSTNQVQSQQRPSDNRGGEEIAASPYRQPLPQANAEAVARPAASAVPRPSSSVARESNGGSYQLPVPTSTPYNKPPVENDTANNQPQAPLAPTASADGGAYRPNNTAVKATDGAKPWYADFKARQTNSTQSQPTPQPTAVQHPMATGPVAGTVMPAVTKRAAGNTASVALEWADLAVESTNATAFQLDYDLESVGPDGLAKVVLWSTRDKGESWVQFGNDDDLVSPVDVRVTEEGLYGFRVQVTGNNGNGAEPPKSGEAADIWIHIDTTPPTAEIQNVPYGRGPTAGKLEIYWTADDIRLASRPVTLRYSESPTGPWTTIAASIPNEGKYLWAIEPNTPKEVYLRLEVTDRAGNIGVDQLTDPVRLQPLIPKARIRGFKPLSGVPLGQSRQIALLR